MIRATHIDNDVGRGIPLGKCRHHEGKVNEIPDWAITVFLLCFSAVPLLFVFLGVGVVRVLLWARKHGEWVMGKVVEVKEVYNRDRECTHDISYQQIFEFAAQDGTLLRGEAVSFGQKNRYPVGSQREVLVDFDKPEMAV